MHTVATMTSLCLKDPVLVQRIGERALSYLYATREHSMLFEATSSANEVHGYSDASFAPMGGRPLGCSVVVYNDTTISWRCGRQSLVALSVAEAELIEAVNAVQQSAGLAELVAELQNAKPQVKLFVDNTAPIGLCTDAAGSWKTRHLRVRAHHLREAVKTGVLAVKHIPGVQQLADLGTKAFDGPRLLELLKLWRIGRWPLMGEAEATAWQPQATGPTPTTAINTTTA